MTLRALTIRAFKCFQQLRLPLAPLTVLTGFNAAGKSTAIQPLLLIAQALRQAPSDRLLALNGSLTRLGTIGEVTARNGKGGIHFGFEDDEASILWKLKASRSYGGRYLSLTSTDFGFAGKHSTTTSALWPKIMTGASNNLPTSIRDIVFLSAGRCTQSEAFPDPRDGHLIQGDVGCEGEFAPWWYVQCADDEIDGSRRHPTEQRTTIRGQIDAYLSDLFPNAHANAEAIARTSLTRLDFRVGKSSDWLRPANIGYGLSYAFPLLVALTTVKSGQLVVVDSPEAHLHPRAQSAIGQILGRFAASGVQLIVETHSDHVLSGIRLSVLNETIRSADVALHFFQVPTDTGETNIISPRIDSQGQLESWPEGFFDQIEKDLAVLSGWKQ